MQSNVAQIAEHCERERQDKLELYFLLKERLQRLQYRKIDGFYPDTGPLRRELYAKHMEFFEAGAKELERAFMAANRVGKTEGAGAYELVLHLTGDYPEWWTGRRFDRHTLCWAAGDTIQTVRNILQKKILGAINDFGSGMLPKESIIGVPKRRSGNVPDVIESVMVRHASGGTSELYFKSYDQKRENYQGTEIDVILLDEEPPLDIYTECLLRLMAIEGRREAGILMLTFTPLMGLSETVLTFLPGGKISDGQQPGKYVVQATWDDVPHLSEREKRKMLDAMPPHQRDARSKGVPQLGAGAIYPIAEEDIRVDDFPIPDHWPRVYGLDVGWNATAVLWGAWDLDSDVLYLYACYKRGQAEPDVHAAAVRGRGSWIPGVADPASMGSNQKDGSTLFEIYRDDHGLELSTANNSVEAGIYKSWIRMTTGKLKVFRSLTAWFEEFRIYRRNEKGEIVKANDHLMDDTRYLVMSGKEVAETPGPEQMDDLDHFDLSGLPGYGSSVSDRMRV